MPDRKVIIRVDGDSDIGLGHIYRGIALAEMLKSNFNIVFVVKRTTIISPVSDAGFQYVLIPNDCELFNEPEWFVKNFKRDAIIVIDGYDFTEDYQSKIKEYDFRLVYIDDLIKGTQKADIVINHSPGAQAHDYKKEDYTKLALGLNYAIVRKLFAQYVPEKRRVNSEVKSVFISFGGADANDFSYLAVKALLDIKVIEEINVVLGAAYTQKAIFNLNTEKLKLHENLTEQAMFDLMKKVDLAIVPASTLSIELAFMGVPMLLGYFVDNQKGIYNGFISENLAVPLGDFNKFNFTMLRNEFEIYLQKLKSLNTKILGNPVNNIIRLFQSENLTIRKATESDLLFVFNLSNESLVRENSYKSDPIKIENHKKWFINQINEENSLFYIFEYDSVPVGQVRFSLNDEYSIIGISISERFRGRGFGPKSLTLAVAEYFRNNNLPILAYIKKSNIASVKSFERAGFIYHEDKIIEGIDSFVYIKREDK